MAKDENATYYDEGGIETLDVIKAKLTDDQYEGFLIGNAMKYLMRYNFKFEARKGKISDLRKALIYVDIARSYIEEDREEGK